MTRTAAQLLKSRIKTIVEQHCRINVAIEEIARLLDDEIEARVNDRVTDLRQQLEQGENR
jgi:hypothetical protein